MYHLSVDPTIHSSSLFLIIAIIFKGYFFNLFHKMFLSVMIFFFQKLPVDSGHRVTSSALQPGQKAGPVPVDASLICSRDTRCFNSGKIVACNTCDLGSVE